MPLASKKTAGNIACGVAVRPGWLLVKEVVGWVEIHYTTSFQNHDLQGIKQSLNLCLVDKCHWRVENIEFIWERKKERQKERQKERKKERVTELLLGINSKFPTVFEISLDILLPFVQISIHIINNYKTKIPINPGKH